MKLLIITQKVNQNDPILGFFHRWIEEFAKHFSAVTVICLEEGEHHLPENVKALSLGKENGDSKLMYIVRFYKYIWNERKNYDIVFVHMNPEYVVLGGWLWKLWHKKIALWYVHRAVNLKLRVAEKCADTIFTSSKESFGIESSKVHFVGHGIDVEKFERETAVSYEPLVIASIGRITKIKHLEVVFRAVKKLRERGVHVQALNLVGAPVTDEDARYKIYLESLAREFKIDDVVHWLGIRPSERAYSEASLTINATPNGGMDKVVLESLAAGRAVFTSNSAFKNIFGDEAPHFVFAFNDADDLANKIESFLKMKNKQVIIDLLATKMREEFDVRKLVEKINKFLS